MSTCRSLTILILWASARCLATQIVTVDQLDKIIGSAAAKHQADNQTAEKIAALELSERITEDRLAALQSRAPGPRTASILEELMQQSAFLNSPAAEMAGVAPPSIEQQRAIFTRVIPYLVSYAQHLPNLIGAENIERFDDLEARGGQTSQALGPLHFKDKINAQVVYARGEETVTVKTIDGKPMSGDDVYGATSNGDFGNIIIALFLPRTKAKVVWSHWETLHGKRLAVFHYSVAAENSHYKLIFGCEEKSLQTVVSAYEGFLFIDADTGTIFRVTRVSAAIPKSFPTKAAKAAVEYGSVAIGDQSYILPIRSVAELESPPRCDDFNGRSRLHSLNVIRFSDYRLFKAESRLVASETKPKLSNLQPANAESLPAPEATAESTAPTTQSALDLPQAPPYREPEKPEVLTNATYATHATFRERLNIVTVPVVVTDTAGHALVGLTKDEFELSDNGKRQLITNFAEQQTPSEEQAGNSSQLPSTTHTQTLQPAQIPQPAQTLQSATSLPNRYISYVFDDTHLTFGDLSQTRAAAERVTKELLDPVTRLAVGTTSGKVTLGFTNDRDKLVAAFNRIKPVSLAPPQSNCPNLSHYMADLIISRNDAGALQEAMEEAISECSAPQQMAKSIALAAAERSLQVHKYETQTTLESIRRIALGMAALPGERSIVLVSPGFYLPADVPGMQDVIDRAARSGVTIQVLDGRGLYGPAGFAAALSGSASPAKLAYQQAAQRADSDPLEQLADATGGSLFRNSNDYDAGFRRLSARPASTYLLGFSPSSNNEDGNYHKLKVTVKGHKGWEVQARLGYVATSATPNTEKRAKEEIQNALLSRDEMREIPISVQSGVNGDAKLSLLIHIDARQILFQKLNGVNRDELTFTFAFFDANGEMLNVGRQDLPLTFSDTDLQARLMSGLNFKTDLDLKQGTQFLRLVLRDAEGQMSTLTEAISR